MQDIDAEMKGESHTWKKEEDRKCRVCEAEMETWDHILNECVETKMDMTVEEILKQDGRDWEIMNRIESMWKGRGEREEKGEERKEEEEQGGGRGG